MRPERQSPRFLFAVLLSGLLGSCTAAPSEPAGSAAARNLLVVTFDTTRADHLSVYGGAAQVPNLERLVREGVRAERAFAPTPLTLPSHVTLFTGLYPAAHGVYNNGSFVLGEEAITLAEVLEDEGFRTGAVIGSRVLGSRYGLGQGFGTYDERMPPEELVTTLHVERRAREVADRGLAWLQAPRTGRWFLWLHFFDPHWEYRPPEPFASRYSDVPYDGEIAYADAELGRVLDHLRKRGVLDETLVVLTSDHGESLGEHGESTHGVFLYEGTVHVPLLMRYPARLGEGRTLVPVASLADVAPTVLDLLGVGAASLRTDGSSLVGLLADKPDLSRAVLLENKATRLDYGWSELAAIRDGRWKYVRAPRPELYDLDADPAEARNLAVTDLERAARYSGALEALLSSSTGSRPPARHQELDAKARRELESLGYVSPGKSAGAPGADPKDKIVGLEAIQNAVGLVSRERYQEAVPALQALLRANPGSTYLRRHLGNSLLQSGRTSEAIREIERGIEGAPEDFGLYTLLGSAYLAAGDPQQAEVSFRTVLRLNPHVAEAHHNLGLLAQKRDDAAGAIRSYERALDEDPDLLRSAVNLGTLYEAAGRTDDAIAMYLKVAELDPGQVRAFFSAGFLLVQAKRYEEALEVLRQAGRAHPGSPLPFIYRARVYRAMGDLDAARRELEAALQVDPTSAEAKQFLVALDRLGS